MPFFFENFCRLFGFGEGCPSPPHGSAPVRGHMFTRTLVTEKQSKVKTLFNLYNSLEQPSTGSMMCFNLNRVEASLASDVISYYVKR